MNHLSSKYLNLQKAHEAGLSTPKTLLLNNTVDHEINKFITHCKPNNQFIIRSIQNIEDGDKQSFAGHFWSSSAVLGNDVKATIEQAIIENQQILTQLDLAQTPQLMLQEFIEHSIGGVLFSPWSFFSEYAVIEYSTVSVQQAVEGQTTPAIISLNSAFYSDLDNCQPSPLALPDNLKFLEHPLQILTRKLHSLFSFPIDCEWVYCEQSKQIILLQVRPQTSLIGPLLGNAPETIINKIKLDDANWQYSALSESLDRLSPLSFSLFKQLYEDAKKTFQSIGYQAKHVDFMQRLPDGTILSDPEREKAFYSSTKMGGFWRGFRAPQHLQKAKEFINTWEDKAEFSYTQLSQLFQLWMVANLLSQGKGREKLTTPLTHAYELSWLHSQPLPSTITNKPMKQWERLNPILRNLFFYELEKLKQQLSQTPEQVFNSWQGYQKDLKSIEINNKDKVLKLQHNSIKYALYDFSLVGIPDSDENTSNNMQSIGIKKAVTGSLFIIDKPSQFRQKIPDGSILIAPYFSNQWVRDIQRLGAIIVERGGQLSHSSIIARESGVPYFIALPEQLKGLLQKYKQGDLITLSTSGDFKLNELNS